MVTFQIMLGSGVGHRLSGTAKLEVRPRPTPAVPAYSECDAIARASDPLFQSRPCSEERRFGGDLGSHRD
jgi:hypothetical protein